MSNNLRPVQIIEKKRDGKELNNDEIKQLIEMIVNDSIQQCQLGAFLMAVFLNGLSEEETASLTRHMAHSGHVFAWTPSHQPITVDKHSTGGVGDKVSIPLAPMLAAAGLKVPMIAGRGLQHTGGTVDKLESIPGYQPVMSTDKFQQIVEQVGCVIAGQSESMVKADKVLYAIRDVTATVNCSGLFLSSILSKKSSEGISSLVMDLKVGRAGLFKTASQAKEVSNQFVSLSKLLGMKCACVLTGMDSPLGHMGHTLEIIESIDMLKGLPVNQDLATVTYTLGAQLLLLTGKCATEEEGVNILKSLVQDGSPLAKFKEMLIACGVDEGVAEQLCSNHSNCYDGLPRAKHINNVTSNTQGYVRDINALELANLMNSWGAGRKTTNEKIDFAVGIQLRVATSDSISKGGVLCVAHTSHELTDEEICHVRQSFDISDDPVVKQSIIIDRTT